MSRRSNGKWSADKREAGQFAALPTALLRSPAVATLSAHASKLLWNLLAQYSGFNNGDLSIVWSLMVKHGWRSKSTLYKACKELIDRGLIEKSRQGGSHMPTLYALTFFNIDECKGKLDIMPTAKPRGTWRGYGASGDSGNIPVQSKDPSSNHRPTT